MRDIKLTPAESLANQFISLGLLESTLPCHNGYGGPEIRQRQPGVKEVSLAEDGLTAEITLKKIDQGFVYEFDLGRLRSRDNDKLFHRNAFCTVNEIPSK